MFCGKLHTWLSANPTGVVWDTWVHPVHVKQILLASWHLRWKIFCSARHWNSGLKCCRYNGFFLSKIWCHRNIQYVHFKSQKHLVADIVAHHNSHHAGTPGKRNAHNSHIPSCSVKNKKTSPCWIYCVRLVVARLDMLRDPASAARTRKLILVEVSTRKR